MLAIFKPPNRTYQPLQGPEKRFTESNTWSNILLVFSLLNAFFLLGTIHRWYGWAQHHSTGSYPTPPTSPLVLDNSQATCKPLDALESQPLSHNNIWHYLSRHEMMSIKEWLEDPAQGMNLTRHSASSLSDNTIFMIDLYNPSKVSALEYFSGGSKPDRQARVTIHHGGLKVPVIRDYVVGPLPVGSNTTIRRLTEIYHQPEIPLNVRGIDDFSEMAKFLLKDVMPISYILEDLFSAVVKGRDDDTITPGMTGPFSYDGSFRRLWMTWRRNTAGSYIQPVNFYQYLDISGTDPSQWSVLKIIYHDQVFLSNAEFIEAYQNGTLKRHKEQTRRPPDITWTQRNRTGSRRHLDDLPGPRSVSFFGKRFKVDREQKHLRWMGWDMFLGFDRDMGLKLWNIQFDRFGRIIYELSPQEAMAQYGGNDPAQVSTAWLDRYFGMGGLVRSMIPHYDCPQDAVYLPATTFSTFGVIEVPRAICIFEQDTGRPLTRHTGFLSGEFGASKTYVLTIRSTTTISSDFPAGASHLKFMLIRWPVTCNTVFDYMFYFDGTIEIRLSASGYMQGGYWAPGKDKDAYGGRIRYNSMGNLHDHVINYKVDFDIAGENNSLLKTSTHVEHVKYDWLDEDWGQTAVQQRITREIISNEDDALLRYPQNFQGHYAIINQEEKNAWGSPRGYAIHPGFNPIHNTVVGSKRLLNNANWARYNLAVSNRKDTEPASSTMWNQHLSGAPPVNFHNFFDGESIDQQDLVAWINLGMHHLPQAEDSPMTKTNIATSSFVLTPLNFFDSDISTESANAILLEMPRDLEGAVKWDNNGVAQDMHCIPQPPDPFEYSLDRVYPLEGDQVDSVGIKKLRRISEGYLRMSMEEF
ncbi:amine oxidase catalytic domain-containing protein [Panaeolus papilionaceus]|nr:amine oxidase catalytic domain-containing protein [Panaeolus papilionaceus]